MTMQIQSTIPILASLDISETIDFYTQMLGFTEKLKMDSYAIVSRDGAELHFWLGTERHIAENTSCYIRVADLKVLYEEFKAKGVSLEPPSVRPWGMEEMYVMDPHGNLIKLGRDFQA
ncbi:MAG: VOC family protein [Methylotenera sp.]|nr:VOC family protein [Methylotenera sp.]